jgi:hypothetical protein
MVFKDFREVARISRYWADEVGGGDETQDVCWMAVDDCLVGVGVVGSDDVPR